MNYRNLQRTNPYSVAVDSNNILYRINAPYGSVVAYENFYFAAVKIIPGPENFKRVIFILTMKTDYGHTQIQALQYMMVEIWKTFAIDESTIPTPNMYTIIADQNNNIWVGTDMGVTRFDGETWTTFTSENSGLCDNKVNAIAVEENNTIWFGTDNGVSRYTGEIITTSVDEEEPNARITPAHHNLPQPVQSIDNHRVHAA